MHQELDCLFNSLFHNNNGNVKAAHYCPFVRGVFNEEIACRSHESCTFYLMCACVISYVKRRINPSEPWLSEGLMKCIEVKNKLYKERVKSPRPLRTEIYKIYRNKLSHVLRFAEKVL